MVSPQAPTGGAIRQGVLHDQSHGQINHAVRVVTARRSQCRHVRVEVLPALGAIMYRIGELNVVRPAREKIAQVMKCSMRSPISITTVSTACAGTTTMIATTPNALRLWKIFGGCNVFGSIWNISTWSHHGGALFGNAPPLGSGREIYPKPRVVSSPKPDFAATVSESTNRRRRGRPPGTGRFARAAQSPGTPSSRAAPRGHGGWRIVGDLG